ncbi:MAG: FCD domain-containing protein [Desulfotignum sp.]|nr:FCD domain-containing protein [Desulfotignum sp.]
MPELLQDAVIRKERVSDQIRTVLKQAILDGYFKPGDKFPPEVEIAAKYRVSKASAREALREMEAEGLIQKKRGVFGGSFVAAPGPEKIMDVVTNAYLFGDVTASDLAELRRILEPGLAALAADRRTEDDLAAMADCIDRVAQSIDNGAPDQTLAISFHTLIADACHNPFISALMASLVHVFQQVLAKTPDLETARQDLAYNRLFYKCIRDRDKARAARVMADHFDTLDEIIQKKAQINNHRLNNKTGVNDQTDQTEKDGIL